MHRLDVFYFCCFLVGEQIICVWGRFVFEGVWLGVSARSGSDFASMATDRRSVCGALVNVFAGARVMHFSRTPRSVGPDFDGGCRSVGWDEGGYSFCGMFRLVDFSGVCPREGEKL